MINSTDLRIGNILDVLNESGVISQDTGYNWAVTAIGLRDGKVELTKVLGRNKISVQYVKYERLSPITLTEEWLLKLSGDDVNPFIVGDFEIYIDDKGIATIFKKQIELVEIKGLHRLMNAVYYLTGEELTIKEVI